MKYIPQLIHESLSSYCPHFHNPTAPQLAPGLAKMIKYQMELGPISGTILMTNNYFHDVATGLLITSFVALWLTIHRYDKNSSAESAEALLSLYKRLTTITKHSLYFILIAGVPRTIFYTRLEWASGVGEMQVPAIIIKHVGVAICVALGVYYWRHFKRVANRISKRLHPEGPPSI